MNTACWHLGGLCISVYLISLGYTYKWQIPHRNRNISFWVYWNNCLDSYVYEYIAIFHKTFDGQSYRLMLLSSETDTTLLLSGLYFTPHTWSLCSLNVWTHFLSAKSHIFTHLSLEDDAKCFPSSENDTLRTQDAWPDNVPATSECALKYYIIEIVTQCDFMFIFHSKNTHTS